MRYFIGKIKKTEFRFGKEYTLLKKRLEKRFKYLYTGELFSVFGFLIASWCVNKAYSNLKLYSLSSFWFALILLEIILLQGVLFWYSKYRQLQKENSTVTPINVVRLLRRLQKLNIVIIIAILFFFTIDFIRFNQSLPIGGIKISVFIYLFAILEYINYFHIQLSYDNSSDIKYLFTNKKLKRAILNKDFERLKK